MRNQETFEHPEEIAIIGMAGRFPQARTIEQFWKKLRDGAELISFFTDEELRAAGATEEMLKDPSFVKAGAVMDGIDLFDASFFGYSPREAEILDPQHRHFLECAWEALETAGYDADRFKGLIGVFAGVSLNSYLLSNIGSNPALIETMGTFQIGINSDKDFLATRIAYELNLKGPSMNIQTACSTSLVAVHVACQSLLNGECDMALAGGVSISILKKMGYFYREGGISSPDGHCRTFDAKGRGIVGGNGLGIVVLKRLSEALEDGDNVIAVIKGSAVNNDGSAKIGYTAPSVDGQAKVIAEAQAIAGADAESISYIEAHGTGTTLGDPIEVAALTQTFRARTQKKGFCALGSVKTNLGHLDAAAGVTGLIKTALSLHHKMIPPSLHFEEPNPRIDFASSPFHVNTRLTEWKREHTPRRAGVSSFGIGGTNAHLILEESPVLEPASESRPWQLLVWSAKTPTALDAMTANLVNHLSENPENSLANAAFTLQTGRKRFNHRRMLVCRDVEDALTSLRELSPRRVAMSYQEDGSRPLIFMFSGQGTQYPNMGLQLYQHEPAFRKRIDDCSEILKPHLGRDLRDVLYPGKERMEAAESALIQTSMTQPALFVVEYALAQLLMEWGIRPQAMIGHSLGEYVAACLAGVFSLEDALMLVAERGRLMQQMPAGAMLGIRLPEQDIEPFLKSGLSLAAVNAPAQCVVAGRMGAIDALQRHLAEQKVGCSRLHTSHAFHSEMMNPALAPFIEKLKKVKLNSPQLPFVSNVTGTWISSAEAKDPQYWADHVRRTVRFSQGVQVLLNDANRIFLEVGPGQTLTALTRQQLNGSSSHHVTVSSLRRVNETKSDVEFLLETLGRLWMAGIPIDWSGFYAHERRLRVQLPTYPFESQRYWIEPGKISVKSQAPQPISGKAPDISQWFHIPLWKQTHGPDLMASRDEDSRNACRLVFVEDSDFGASIAERWEWEGLDVVRALPGKEFAVDGKDRYRVNPHKRDDYDALLKDLRAKGRVPRQIIHMWSANPPLNAQPHTGGDIFEEAQWQGFYSLLFLVQSLTRQSLNQELEITVVTGNAQDVTGAEVLAPERATLLAACKVIPQEYPYITCRSIDIELPISGGSRGKQLLDQLFAEVTSKPSDLVVAYRGNHRWVETFEPLRLEGGAATSKLQKGGVYLITGGLGRKGMLLASHLAATVQAKLILTTRSVFPSKKSWEEWLESHGGDDEVSRKIRRLRTLEDLGAEVIVACADVADREQMRKVVDRTIEQFGQLNGVIHTAVQTDGFMQTIQETDVAHCRRQFHPKAKGLYVLEEVLKDRRLDFCLLMSSLSSVLGGLGFFAFAAANTFMDAFARRQNRKGATPWISIDWDGWSLRDGESVAPTPGDTSILPDEGVEVFTRVLSRSFFTPTIVSTSDLQSRITQWVKLESLKGDGRTEQPSAPTLHTRPNLQTPYVAPGNDIERAVAEIWQSLLGIERVGIHDNLFDLGGDSLLVVQIVARLRETLRVEVALRAVFETPVIAELATVINELLQARQEETEKITETLNLVEQLSDEELMLLLSETENSPSTAREVELLPEGVTEINQSTTCH